MDFWKQYKGVVVNAHVDGGHSHFAIRKPHTSWFKLPKFIKNMFPYDWIMLKNSREEMYELKFFDYDRSIEITGDIQNSSCRKLTFDEDTYNDLRACIPVFLKEIGFKFHTINQGSYLNLVFEVPEYRQ